MEYGMFKRAVMGALLMGVIFATAACGGTSTEEQGNTASSEPKTIIKTVQSEPETAVEEKTVGASAESDGGLSPEQQPEEVLARQYEYINEENYRAAYELFAEQSQQKVSFQQYRAFFEDIGFYRVEDYSFPSTQVGEDEATVDVVFTSVTPTGEGQLQKAQQMVLESGSWRIIMREDQIEAFIDSTSGQSESASGEATDQNTIPGDGTFLVGEDIQPGTYRTAGGEFCTWERLSGTSGSFEDVITGGVAQGPTTVTISPSDAAFKTSGCPVWKRR